MSKQKLAIFIALPVLAVIIFYGMQDNPDDQTVQISEPGIAQTRTPKVNLQKSAQPEQAGVLPSEHSLPAVAARPTPPEGLSTPGNPDETPESQMGGPIGTDDFSGPEYAPEFGDTGEPGLPPEAYESDVPGMAPEFGMPTEPSPSPDHPQP